MLFEDHHPNFNWIVLIYRVIEKQKPLFHSLYFLHGTPFICCGDLGNQRTNFCLISKYLGLVIFQLYMIYIQTFLFVVCCKFGTKYIFKKYTGLSKRIWKSKLANVAVRTFNLIQQRKHWFKTVVSCDCEWELVLRFPK